MNFSRLIIGPLAISFCLCLMPCDIIQAADKPAAEKPAEAKPAEQKPPAEKPAEAKPPAAPPAAQPAAPPAAQPAAPPVAKPPAKPEGEPKKKEPRLRFNFRFQAWADVLDWFAKQADLALVLDAPVPGTFNYTDTNEYTPTEAIDLLNGVLLTKGYTLIRRDRMLMVVNLQDGIPEGMVPRVTIEELSKRGRFEIVSVLLPLKSLNAEEVNKEITPLLGPYGKSVPMVKTGQLLVTDTAGILQAVDAMIKSMPAKAAPPAKPKPPEKPKPEPPALKVYPIKSADPAVAVEVLKSLLPEAKIVLDAKAAQINIFAVPAHQAVAESVINQMHANNPPETNPRLEVYDLKSSHFAKGGGKEGRLIGKQLVKTLEVIAPEARISVDPNTAKVAVWATPEQHAMISATLEKLRGGSSPADSIQIEVHRLTTIEPDEALALLSKLMPDAQFAVDAHSRSLIAIALPEEQAAIRTTLAELQGGTSKIAGDRLLKSYRLSKPAAPTLVTGLRLLAPAAQISIGPEGQLLTVVASETDQKAIEAAVKQIEEPVANRQLEVYPLDDLTPDSTMQLLRTLVPRAEVSFDTQTQSLVVLGVAADLNTIQATLKQLRSEQQGPAAVELLFYPLEQIPPPSLIDGLKQLVPRATITLEAGGKRLMVVAKAADHARIAASLKRLTENVPSQAQRFEVYAIGGIDATSLSATLGPLVPEAKLSVDPKTNRILVWASEADHKVLKAAVGRLEKGGAGQEARKMEIHKLKKADPTAVLSLMQTIVPQATLSIDAPTRSLAALATPAQQETIRRALERLESSRFDDSPVLRFHELLQTPPPTLVTGISQMFPEATITLDGKRLMIIADEDMHRRIKAEIARIEATMPIAEPKKLATYAVTPAEKARFNAVLPTIITEMPGVAVAADSEPGVLTIWAKPTEHILLADIIKQLKLDVPDDQKHRFVGYPIASADPTVVLSTLQTLLPDAKLSLDTRTKRLLAWCSPTDHEKIKQALEQMDSGTAEDAQDQLMVYPVPDTNPTVALQVLTQILPGVQFHSDTTAGTIIATARKSDHKIIAKTLKEMQASQDLGVKRTMEVYQTGQSDPQTVVASISGEVPKAILTADTVRGRISAWASAKDQETIRQAVEKMAAAEDAKTAPTVASYRLGRLQPVPTMTMLRQIAPQAQVAMGADSRQIIVWARPADQERVAKTFDRMKSGGTDEDQSKVVVYTLEATPPSTATQVIAQAVPTAIVAPNSDPQQLVVWAQADEHAEIKTLLDQLAEGNPPTELKTYTLESVTAAVASPIITQTAPQALVAQGTDPQQLIVRARPADHQKIAAALTQLTVKEDPKTAPMLKTYTLQSIAPSMAMPIITQTAPQAVVTYGGDPQQLIIRARPADHEKIATVLSQLDAEEDPKTAPSLKTYTLESIPPSTATPLISQAVPQTMITTGTDTQQLIIRARPADHAKIAALLSQIDVKEDPNTAPALKTYTLKSISPSTATPLITQAIPRAMITAGADPQQLIIRARPADHTRIEALLAQIDVKEDPQTAPLLKTYTLESVSPSIATPVILQAVPHATINPSSDPQQLIIRARPVDHDKIAALVAQLDIEEDPKTAPTVTVYTLETAGASSLLPVLQTAAPLATITVGPEPHKLVVRARPSDHAIIKAAIDELAKSNNGETASKVLSYKINTPYLSQLIGGLQTMMPAARFTSGAEPGQLIAWASPSDHKKIKAIIDEIGKGSTGKMVVYTLSSTTATNAISLLTQAVPRAKLSVGSEPQTLMAWADDEDHALIKAAVDELEKAEDEANSAKAVVYEIGQAPPSSVISNLSAVVPTARITMGSRLGQIIAWASPADHKKIKQIVDAVGAKSEDKMVVYTVESATAAGLLPMLRQAVPRATLSVGADPNKLIAWALVEDHAIIKAAVDEIARSEKGESASVPVVYQVGSMPAAQVMSGLRTIVPGALFTVGAKSNQLVAWARPADQEKIKKIIDEMTKEKPGKMVVYTLETTTAGAAISVLSEAFPGTRFATGKDARQLIAWASDEDHARLDEAVKKLSEDQLGENAPTAKAYTLKTGSFSGVLSMLQTAVPEARLVLGNNPRQMTAWASPGDHEKIAQIVDAVDTKSPAKMVVYTVDSVTAASLLPALRLAAPRAQLSVGTDPHKLIAWAADDDQAIIKAAVDEIARSETGETASVPVVYQVGSVPASRVMSGLRTIVPGALFTVGAKPNQLVAWARPADQEKIKKIVDEMTKEQPGKMVVYTLETTTATAAIKVLTEAFPATSFAVGTDTRQLIAWVSDEDHERLAEAVKRLSQDQLGENAPTAQIYTIKSGSFAAALPSLRQAVPEAELILGSDPRVLTAWARPNDHKKIAQVVEQMTKIDASETAPRMEVYELKSSDATDAIRILQVAFEQVRFSPAGDGKRLMAWARPDEQALIKAAVEQIEAAGAPEEDLEMAVYPMKYEDTASLLQVLDPLLARNAKFVTDPKRDGLIVWADKENQAAIKKAIDEFQTALPKTREPVTRVYYFRTGNPSTAATVLSALVPTARMAVNAQNRSLAVSAKPDEHEKIKTAVEQIDREGDAEQAPRLEAHRITSADPTKLFTMLRAFFRRQSEIQFSLDAENETVMALASPRDHQKIKALIAEVEKGSTADGAPKVEVYSLKNVDSDSLEEVLGKLLEKDIAKVQMSVDSRSDQLVVIARAKHHQIISDTIDRMRTEEQTMEIFQLDVVDPSTATLAIDRLFDSGGYGFDPTAPVVDVDEDTQQLFVSATEEQHAKIRKLLAQMGETNLKKVTAEQQGNMRVIPFRGDTRSTVEEIRRLWPQIGNNPIEVVDAEARKQEAIKVDSKGAKKKPESEKDEKKSKAQPEKPAKKSPDKSAAHGLRSSAVFRLVSMRTEEKSEEAKTEQKAKPNPKPKPAAAKEKAPSKPDTVAKEKSKPKTPDKPKAPVLLIVGTNAITVKSDDPEALEQMESLLRSLTPHYAYGRNIGVFPLVNTDAVQLAARLQLVMVQMRPRWQRNQTRTMIVADDRLNAIVVKGPRAERETIESMVRILDAPESAETLQSKQPTLIPVKNTEATRVEQVVREVFSSQLDSSTKRGPRGMGSSRWSPRVSVDSMSNSLIVVADPALLKQIEDLVATLDTAAGDESARGLKIISLKKASASRVEKALGAAIQKSVRRRARR